MSDTTLLEALREALATILAQAADPALMLERLHTEAHKLAATMAPSVDAEELMAVVDQVIAEQRDARQHHHVA